MRHYQQDGSKMSRIYLHESGNICGCCESFSHSHTEESHNLPDDVECDECGQLCACSCHRKEDDAA